MQKLEVKLKEMKAGMMCCEFSVQLGHSLKYVARKRHSLLARYNTVYIKLAQPAFCITCTVESYQVINSVNMSIKVS